MTKPEKPTVEEAKAALRKLERAMASDLAEFCRTYGGLQVEGVAVYNAAYPGEKHPVVTAVDIEVRL